MGEDHAAEAAGDVKGVVGAAVVDHDQVLPVTAELRENAGELGGRVVRRDDDQVGHLCPRWTPERSRSARGTYRRIERRAMHPGPAAEGAIG
jgi:hypothetical protein